MKKTLKLMGLCALAMLALAGCKKNEQQTTGSLTAKLTQPVSESKTHIGAGWLRWNVNDAIKVFDAAGTAYSFTTTDNDSIVASFDGATGIYATQAYTAFYPEANTSDVTDGYVYLTLPGSQTFDEATFASNTYPMLATNGGSGTTFTFHSPCGVLAIPMTGTATIGSIVLIDNNYAPLNGNMKISLAGLDPINTTYTFVDTSNATTLSCGGLTLDPTTPQTFVFVVPAGVFANGFTAVINDTSGNEIYVLATSNDNTIVKETITTMPVVNISGISVTTGTAEPDPTDATKYILHGSFSAPLGTRVDEVGFYYGEGTSLTKQAVTPTGNNFSLTITVAPGQTITYKAYAKNGMNEIVDEAGASSFIVFAAPTVTTGTAAATSATTATGHVTLTNAGTTALTDIELGICWGTSPNPEVSTITSNHASVSGTLAVGTEYAVDMTGLTATTSYYVRGYAKIGGVYYYDTTGGTVSFTTPAAIPTGAINGKFSVSATQQVYFSKGNLKYSNGTWSFHEHQYDRCFNSNINVSSYYTSTGTFDLFGWGTSGWNNGNHWYMPYNTDKDTYTMDVGHGYGPTDGSSYQYDLTGAYAEADWAWHNAISNGGNTAHQWRTLTQAEWIYLFNTRADASSKWGNGRVNGVNGLIVLPDTWTLPTGLTFTSGISSWANSYTLAQWDEMEAAGAVFLPAAGNRSGTTVEYVDYCGRYWSTSNDYGQIAASYAYYLYFRPDLLNPEPHFTRHNGLSVRPVQDAN